MTLQNGDSQRKSSVYNQTGQNYFEQLSSYNRMNSHLRRILMAQSVVDARNQKYIREKRLNSRSSSCSKSLDQILSRRDFIDGVAYDTEHHPIDLLRMRLGCEPSCLHMARKRSFEQSYRSCSNIRCRGGSPRTSRRPEINSDVVRCSRTSASGSPTRYQSSYGASRSSLLTGRRVDQQPEVESRRHKINDGGRNGQSNRRSRAFEAINETYSYDSSFESSSDTSGIDSPVAKNCECPSSRPNFDSSPERTGNEVDRGLNKFSDNAERTEEAKYAKFLYNITQEIVLNGLYTDQELHGVFNKHVEMNCGCLDKERMLSEINQLKTSLNVKEFLEDGKFPEHTKNNQKTKRPEDSSRRSNPSQAAKNAILLVDTSPEVLLTEREVLVTLMEMKLDPQQVQTICRSLRNKIKETNGVDFRDDNTQVLEEESPKIIENCKCQCRGENQISIPSAAETRGSNLPIKTEESQTEAKTAEVVSQASQVKEQTMEITTSTSVGELRKETRDISLSNSELQKLAEVSQQTVIKSDGTSAKSKTSDSLKPEEPKSRKSSLTSDEDEKIQNVTKTRSRLEKTFSAAKKSAEFDGQVDQKESQRVFKSSEDVDNKIGQVRKSSERKSTNSKKSPSPSRARKSTRDDRKTSDSVTSKKSVDLDKSRGKIESTKIEASITDEEATTTEIATEKASLELKHEKIEEITDDELASLPEDISQEMDESLSTIDSEKAEVSRASKAKSTTEKPRITRHESSEEKKVLHGIEESEEEPSTSPKPDQKVRESSKSANDSEDPEDDVIVGKAKKKSRHDEVKNDKNEKFSAPSSPNNRRSKISNGKETSAPQKMLRKSNDSGDKKTGT
ncbi:uncharacterized protein [Venturia canescens]|uniref:uncharacterized protein n=1 Tax=Venturia canescens TaxID=32260 RepID=UPI001C9BCA51|nr:uncharacterized protein LOC122409718 [Venturia canescens]